ncbi:MAG: hypothetical protein PHS14_04970 [Elusimicrobia bacterium]|nr:hypothetical protein [Elusimicrobiota bacterium]
MTSATNDMARSVVGGGAAGNGSVSSSYRLDSGSGEEVMGSTATASATNRINPGYVSMFAFPGAVTDLTGLDDVSISSVALQWTTPGVDGSSGTFQTGSSYFLRVASYTVPDTFTLFSAAVAISTSAKAPGTYVGGGVTGLIPNTTYFVSLWSKSENADLSYPKRSTFTTLSLPPVQGALEFLSVQRSSVTVAWAALTAAPPDASSMTSEGYVLQASSNDFGALAPAGAPVFSSMTYNVLNSTLSLGVAGVGLDLGSTYYFRVGSLNHESRINYTYLPRLNFQILQSTGLISLGAIDPSVTRSSVSMSSMVVVNLGNWPVTLELAADMATVPASAWTLGTAPGIETAALMSVIKSGVIEPQPSDFSTNLTPSYRACGVAGNYAGAVQNCVQIPPGQSRTFWFRFIMPDSSASLGPETIRVATQPVYP